MAANNITRSNIKPRKIAAKPPYIKNTGIKVSKLKNNAPTSKTEPSNINKTDNIIDIFITSHADLNIFASPHK